MGLAAVVANAHFRPEKALSRLVAFRAKTIRITFPASVAPSVIDPGWLLESSFQKLLVVVLAVVLTLTGLYGIGIFASLVLGRMLIDMTERMLGRLSLVRSIFGGSKRFFAWPALETGGWVEGGLDQFSVAGNEGV